MTKEEYEKFIKERREKGYSNEDIVKIYCILHNVSGKENIKRTT